MRRGENRSERGKWWVGQKGGCEGKSFSLVQTQKGEVITGSLKREGHPG